MTPVPPSGRHGLCDGGASVGKTALAVHWAHQLADRFPDGQLFSTSEEPTRHG